MPEDDDRGFIGTPFEIICLFIKRFKTSSESGDQVMSQTSDVSGPTINPTKLVVGGYKSDCFDELTKLLRGIVPVKAAERGIGSSLFAERLVIPKDPSDIDVLTAELGYDESNVLMLFIENLESVIANAAGKGRSLSSTADEWHAVADRLLSKAEKNPSRVLLFATDEVLASPSTFIESLGRRLGAQFAYAGVQLNNQKYEWDDFYLLLGHQFVRENKTLAALAAAIRSRRDFVPATSDAMQVDWSAALSDVNRLRDENRILFGQLHKLQLDFEHNFLKLKQTEDEARELATRISETKRSLASAEKARDESLRRLEDRDRQISRIRRSFSWRITWPLRAGMRLVSKVFRR